MAGLISLDVAKLQLRITDAAHDADVQLKLLQAEAIILDYLKPKRTGTDRPDWPWTAATLPGPVQAAMLVMLQYLYDDARNTDNVEASDPEKVWTAVDRLLTRFRDRALA